MLFPTAEYALFFLCVFAGSWALHRRAGAHKAFLLLASYAFYGFWDARFLPVLIGLSLVGFGVAALLQRTSAPARSRLWLGLGVALCLATLGVFKYLGFFALEVLPRLGLRGRLPSVPEVTLPVGISFFTFHALSLMVDAYRKKIPVPVTFVDALLYVAFFPQLVAGPILRASSFLPQLAARRDPYAIDASRALELIALGLVKKVLLANFLATRWVDPVFEMPSAHAGWEVLLAIYGYAAQIYCDFSAYTDLGTGSALLLGYTFPPNFDAPYGARSPQEFWRRWHISLSTWLRDYLFIPLGGSRHGPLRTAAALALTMLLGGLWHGAAWTFVLWGAVHAGGLLVHRVWSQLPFEGVVRLREQRAWAWVARALTFHFVCAAWVLFRAPSVSVATEVVAQLGEGGAWPGGLAVVSAGVIALSLGAQGLPPLWGQRLRRRFARWPLVAQGLALAALVFGVELLGPEGIAPFIYFQF